MRKLVSDTGLYNVAESIDRLINVDIGARGTAQVLFDAARDLLGGKPMTLAAVELMQRSIKPGDYVFITTGWADQPANLPTKSETDGPPGAANLARTIRLTLKGLPVIVTDDYLVDDMKTVMASCGFSVVEPDHLKVSLSDELGFAMVPTIAVIGMPIDQEECRIRAEKLLDQYKPALCLAIERGGMNKHGRIHGMGGFDFSANQAKMDYLFTGAKDRGIATIGIGDGGNEIGMANIEKTVREKVKNGNMCSRASLWTWRRWMCFCLRPSRTGPDMESPACWRWRRAIWMPAAARSWSAACWTPAAAWSSTTPSDHGWPPAWMAALRRCTSRSSA